MLTLMKIWRFDDARVDQALYACPLFGSITGKTSLKIVIHIVDHLALIRCIGSLLSFNLLIYFSIG